MRAGKGASGPCTAAVRSTVAVWRLEPAPDDGLWKMVTGRGRCPRLEEDSLEVKDMRGASAGATGAPFPGFTLPGPPLLPPARHPGFVFAAHFQ